MSKIYEALDNARADAGSGDGRNFAPSSGPADAHAGSSVPAMFSRVSMEEEMARLRHHLDALLPDLAHKAIEFIGSREGEGTSTVVYEFARVSAMRFGQRVLLLDMDPSARAQGSPGMGLDRTLADAAPSRTGGGTLDITPLPQELLAESQTTDSRGPASAWARLRTQYDLVLVDAPPATTSPQGLAVSSQVDGVVLVLAAEDTRWPVVERVKQSLERSSGRVLGIVLNKRRYHIPPFIYSRL
jgi:Mrp family chromosome partitioning ATPase